jgi:arsenate reductase-like glutaredoxin family protein
VVNAGKAKLGRSDALKLAKAASRIVAMRGKKIMTFDMKKDAPGDDEILAVILGPTGNLRAPTLRIGKTLVVGFSEEAYKTAMK